MVDAVTNTTALVVAGAAVAVVLLVALALFLSSRRSHGDGQEQLLQLVGETVRANIRPYDVIVRYGGDEFICAMSNLSAPEDRETLREDCRSTGGCRCEALDYVRPCTS